MMVIYSGMESGGILYKDPTGEEEWSDRDIKKAMKQRAVHGYDAKFKSRSVYIPVENIACMYIVNKADAEEEMKNRQTDVETIGSKIKDGMMFG